MRVLNQFFVSFYDPAKTLKLHYVKCEMLVFASQGTPFGQQKSIQKSILPGPLFGLCYVDFINTKIVDLGIPSESSGRQNPPTPAGARRCQTNECRV